MPSFDKMQMPTIFPIYLLKSSTLNRRRHQILQTLHVTDKSACELQVQCTRPGSLNGCAAYLHCGRCAADLCSTSSIVSRGFTGRWGRAYLVSAPSGLEDKLKTHSAADSPSLPNTHIHKPVARQLVTGAHTVSDISCAFCGNILGWKYVAADEESQRYKVGKYILETRRVNVAVCWETDNDRECIENLPESLRVTSLDEEQIEFDSQDEEECEDLFAGIWRSSVAAKRRQTRCFGKDKRR